MTNVPVQLTALNPRLEENSFQGSLARIVFSGISILFLLLVLFVLPRLVHAEQLITNTVTASYSINGTEKTKSSSAELAVNIRTPSTITFLKIDEIGTDLVIPPTAYNDNQTGGKHWQEVSTIKLADGTVVNLPTPQPLVKADQYQISEPIVIQVKDLDQNTDSTKIDTIFITVAIPGTNEKEVLLLRETSPNSGIFRGVLATTHAKIQRQDGQLSLKPGQKITVTYRDEEDSTDTSATAAFVATSSANLPLSKTVDKTTATIGELVRYTLTFTNTSKSDLVTLKIKDTLPLGVRYVEGSAKLNDVALFKNKITSTGRLLQFNLTKMSRGDEWTLKYLAKITAGVKYGKITNQARLSSGSERSNLARASLIIKDDLMRNKSILSGRVYIGCERHKNPKLLENARIYLETGRSVLSDKNGLWHMEGVNAGTHVLQLDTDSLPEGYSLLDCGNNTRQARDKNSQFVDLQAGALWRADFHVQTNGHQTVRKNNDNVTSKPEVNPFKRFDKSYLNNASNNFEILWPKNNFVPRIASTSILIKTSLQQRVVVYLNGSKVSPLNYDGSKSNRTTKATLHRWKGVDLDIKNRDNILLVILKDKSGKELARKTHNIHFSGAIASAEFLEDKSILVADGKTVPTIAVQIKDEDGYPMRANTHGYFTLKDNRFQVKTLDKNDDEMNITGGDNGKYKYHIKEGGIAYIRLNPTSQAGEINIELELGNNKKKEITTWLTPKLRQWILVGLAEGTVAHKTLSGNMQALKASDKEEVLTKEGRVAFFAKGRVKGKYLLTAAYDSHKQKSDINKLEDETNNNIDPDAWYLLYADNSHSQYDAASSSKLYLKIENNKFYALFGDYRSNMTVTELASYERTLHGIKSEYKGDRLSYKSFVSITSNKHFREEIQGDGTSGLYHLNKQILVNSESIKIETRDRFRSDKIIESRVLTRYQDYEIDYDAGTLFFKFPINGRDKGFNPQFIVVDYESESDKNKLIVAGTRIAAKSNNNKLEVGASLIHVSGDGTPNDRIMALDASYKINANTKLHAEIASSKSTTSSHDNVGAQLLTLEKETQKTQAKFTYRRQAKGFGLGTEGSSSASQVGTEKIAAELRYKINNKLSLNAEVSQQKNIATGNATDNKRQLAEIKLKRQEKQFSVTGGLRHTKEALNAKTITNTAVIGGTSYTTKGGKVTYRADFEQNFNKDNGTERSPNRKVMGIDVKVKRGTSVFAEHEITDNKQTKTQNSRVGITQSLWQGAKAKGAYTKERTDNAQRDYATVGLSQRIQVSKHLSANITVDHAKTLGKKQARFNNNEATPQGTNNLRDDYTAFSVGMGSHIKDWSWTGRFEMRDGDLSDKTNLRLGLIHRLKNGREVSARFSYIDTENSNGSYDASTKLSLGTAWHPTDKDFIFYSRLDLVDQNNNKQGASKPNGKAIFRKTHTQKIIHNMHLNRRISKKTQLSVHHGLKHLINNNDKKYNSTFDTTVIQLRRDLNKKWDIGVKAGYLHDWDENTLESVAGLSVGVTPARNIWFEAGYNVEGFNDEDFDSNSYSTKGPYLSFRYKFNQDSFKKNQYGK